MDKFTTLEPVRLYQHQLPSSTASTRRQSKAATSSLSSRAVPGPAHFQLIGRLPVDLHILILAYAAVPDFPAYARANRALSALARDERVWELRWRAFGIEAQKLAPVVDALEERTKTRTGLAKAHSLPTLAVDADDEFGDFAAVSAPAAAEEMGDFVGAFPAGTFGSPTSAGPSKPSYRQQYIRAHSLLKPLLPALSAPSHAVLSVLFPQPAPPPRHQAHTLRLLALWLSPRVQPLRNWVTLSAALHAAIDRFEDGLLVAFDAADSRGDEAGMRDAAEASWEVWDRRSGGEWELGRTWAEKREIFYEQGRWRPLDNFTQDGALDFDAMDAFVGEVLAALKEHGARAVRVFPPETAVLVSFADRLAVDVVGEYIQSVLTRARELDTETFLKATAATFKEAWRMVDAVLAVSKERADAEVSTVQAEDVVYRMFETHMDEYLDEEVEWLKSSFERTCREWEHQLTEHTTTASASSPNNARFVTAANPAQVKRNVLASFSDALLRPVALVPRTIGTAFTTGTTAAAQGIAMLNPQRWSTLSMGAQRPAVFPRLGSWRENERAGYAADFGAPDGTLFDIGESEEVAEKGGDEKAVDETVVSEKGASEKEKGDVDSEKTNRSSVFSTTSDTNTAATSVQSSRTGTPAPAPSLKSHKSTTSQIAVLDQLDLLLSLDTALELIHADRESLKRVEAFAGYPGMCGHRVRDTIEELFVLLLQAFAERHIRPGFDRATGQMRAYQPEGDTRSVAPLLQFFELVHIGDTMQSMVQVYFDKELVSHIDKKDFLNPVVREKKRFEDTLDDCVAAGLNAGTDALMNQVEHIIQRLTQAREYYPPEDAPLELGPTKGCTEAIQCLQMHCQLLKGSTSKEVLEVFYQEIGIRLIAIIQKHLKRQIISLNGGWQVIADLNAYAAFIQGLKVPSIAAEFSYLKMLGHVFVVEDAKELAQIVRDVTRYGGAYKPEDVYEFIQRRADWKKIEKTVDKTMYNLSFKEDCVVC